MAVYRNNSGMPQVFMLHEGVAYVIEPKSVSMRREFESLIRIDIEGFVLRRVDYEWAAAQWSVVPPKELPAAPKQLPAADDAIDAEIIER